ncbi:GM13696 [Drosophila sechellia]|uniref:GM13696 n=1 Tax=Drosophila sechellia TaxID=7238 RepID=B4IJT2_DROSE|nr:GM13696 [Drosophila sechellia]
MATSRKIATERQDNENDNDNDDDRRNMVTLEKLEEGYSRCEGGDCCAAGYKRQDNDNDNDTEDEDENEKDNYDDSSTMLPAASKRVK